MMKPYRSYQEDLITLLKDPEEAAGYLNAALEEGDKDLFLLALRNVIEAQGNLSRVAKLANLNRVSLYRMLSKNGNPGFANVLKLLKIAGVRFRIISIRGRSGSLREKKAIPGSLRSQ